VSSTKTRTSEKSGRQGSGKARATGILPRWGQQGKEGNPWTARTEGKNRLAGESEGGKRSARASNVRRMNQEEGKVRLGTGGKAVRLASPGHAMTPGRSSAEGKGKARKTCPTVTATGGMHRSVFGKRAVFSVRGWGDGGQRQKGGI